MDFAKIYRAKRGQILAVMGDGDSYKPCIKFCVSHKWIRVCCVTVPFKRWDQCEVAFRYLTKETAEEAVAVIYAAVDRVYVLPTITE